MSAKRMLLRLAALVVSLTVSLGIAAPAQAQGVNGGGGCASDCCAPATCGTGCFNCQIFHCPPALQHCQERPPCINIVCGCPRPVCCPCDKANWGYNQTCWRPWPWPPNFSHCAPPGPATFVPMVGTERRDSLTTVPAAKGSGTLPMP